MATPALPWARPPSPPAKRARTEAPTSWATFPASQPARFGLKAGDRVQVAWTFVREEEGGRGEPEESQEDPSPSFCSWCAATLEAVPGEPGEWQLRYDSEPSPEPTTDDDAAAPVSPPAAPAAEGEAPDTDPRAPDALDAAADIDAALDAAAAVLRGHEGPALRCTPFFPAPAGAGSEEVCRVHFLTSCRLRDGGDDPEPLFWRQLGRPLVVEHEELGGHDLSPEERAAEEAADEEHMARTLASVPAALAHQLAGRVRAFVERVTRRACELSAARGDGLVMTEADVTAARAEVQREMARGEGA